MEGITKLGLKKAHTDKMRAAWNAQAGKWWRARRKGREDVPDVISEYAKVEGLYMTGFAHYITHGYEIVAWYTAEDAAIYRVGFAEARRQHRSAKPGTLSRTRWQETGRPKPPRQPAGVIEHTPGTALYGDVVFVG